MWVAREPPWHCKLRGIIYGQIFICKEGIVDALLASCLLTTNKFVSVNSSVIKYGGVKPYITLFDIRDSLSTGKTQRPSRLLKRANEESRDTRILLQYVQRTLASQDEDKLNHQSTLSPS